MILFCRSSSFDDATAQYPSSPTAGKHSDGFKSRAIAAFNQKNSLRMVQRESTRKCADLSLAWQQTVYLHVCINGNWQLASEVEKVHQFHFMEE